MGLQLDPFVTSVLLLLICVLYYLYTLSTNTYNYWYERGVKFVKPLPLIGNSKNLFLRTNTPVVEQSEVYKKYPEDKYVGLFNFRQPSLFVRDPEVIQDVLTKGFSHFHDRDKEVDLKTNPLAANLASLTGIKWKNLRKKLTPVFTSGKLKTMMDEIEGCAAELVSFLDETASQADIIEVRNVMSQFTTNVIGSVAFGIQLNTLKDPNSEFIKKGKQVFTVSYRRIISFLLTSISPTLTKLIGFRSGSKEVSDFYFNFVKKSVAFREENNFQRNDYLQLLINLRKEDASGPSQYVQNSSAKSGSESKKLDGSEDQIILDDTLMAANVFIFFVAGFETTASTLSNCLLELAANPDVQQKLREEILKAKRENEKLSYDVVKDMKYLEQVISETLRKYSVAISLNRICTQKYQIPGTDVVIDEGVRVVIPVYSLHKDPKYYPDPEKFDPERFSEENKKNIRNGTYLPFGDGPRICIGLRFALLEMKVALAHVLSRYEFSMTNKMAYPLEFSKSSFLLAPKDGIWLKVTKLNQQ